MNSIYDIYNFVKEIVMKILISNSSNEPIYEQICNQIKAMIIKGDIAEGEALPSIRNLAKELHISVITTKRAYEELEKEGFIETVRGKGSFVAGQNKELLREKKLKIIEEKLSEVVEESKFLGLEFEEILEILKILYDE
jgi:GntR family transcriptional regulator